MADNYLEKRFEEVFGSSSPKSSSRPRKGTPSLDTLLHRNRSTRGYDPSRIVSLEELHKIIAVNTLVASAGNAQTLRFRAVTKEEASGVVPLLKMGAALPELSLPFPGTEPGAFIVVCSTVEENRFLDIDLGISLQSMGLKCSEMGLSSLIVCSFDRIALKEVLSLPLDPLAVLCVGKGAESIYLMPIDEDESRMYYRHDGVHYVPKLRLEALLI